MSRLLLLPCLCLSAITAAQQDSITLDPVAMEEAWRAVTSPATAGAAKSPVLQLPGVPRVGEASREAQLWAEAQQAVQSPTFPVLVLSLLQSLNPQQPMQDSVWQYASALELHRQAFIGNARARREMAVALRSGKLCGLNYFVDTALAAALAAPPQPALLLPEGGQ